MSFLFLTKLSSTAMIVMHCCNQDLNGISALWWAHRETVFKRQRPLKHVQMSGKLILFSNSHLLPIGGKQETRLNRDIKDQHMVIKQRAAFPGSGSGDEPEIQQSF